MAQWRSSLNMSGAWLGNVNIWLYRAMEGKIFVRSPIEHINLSTLHHRQRDVTKN